MKITEKNGIVKWEDDFGKLTGQEAIDWAFERAFEKMGLYLGDKRIFPCTKINLLPEKESNMKTRYVVVNQKEKEEFEKRWEMPYGYNNSPKISFNQNECIKWVNRNLGPKERKDYVVERHNAGKIDVVWKIMDGHKLAGEQEEEDYDEDF